MKTFTQYIKTSREKKNLLIREVAHQLIIDAALMSRIESGKRVPTRKQVIALAHFLDIKEDVLLAQWLGEKIARNVYDEHVALKALMVAEEQVRYGNVPEKQKTVKHIAALLKEIDVCKKQLKALRDNDSYRIAEALELEYTYQSNRIEGNTLTLKETDLVINEGITIAGKTMREHLEAINHTEAISFMKDLVHHKSPLNESNLLKIHGLILRGIDAANAGIYRRVQVMIKGSKHMPPQPYLVAKQMEAYFIWYQKNKKVLHPVLLATEMHERLVAIHPFIDGNGRTARLVMNLILLQNGYVITNIKGDNLSRAGYYDALEKAQTTADKNPFNELMAKAQLDAIKNYLKILGG